MNALQVKLLLASCQNRQEEDPGGIFVVDPTNPGTGTQIDPSEELLAMKT